MKIDIIDEDDSNEVFNGSNEFSKLNETLDFIGNILITTLFTHRLPVLLQTKRYNPTRCVWSTAYTAVVGVLSWLLRISSSSTI
jgi:hypothetical protein